MKWTNDEQFLEEHILPRPPLDTESIDAIICFCKTFVNEVETTGNHGAAFMACCCMEVVVELLKSRPDLLG